MKKTLKTSIASLMTAAVLMTGFTGVVASAAETNNNKNTTGITTEMSMFSSQKSFSFPNVGTSGSYCTGTITLTSAKSVTFSYGCCPNNPAHISIRNASNDKECGSFNIPVNTSGTLTSTKYLEAGTYRFYVTPFSGYSTTGGFSVTY